METVEGQPAAPLPKYHSVNSKWPPGTNDGRDIKPTAQEAVSAAKRLYRFMLKKPFRGKIVVTSGNRYSYIRSGVMYVNPDWKNAWASSGGGWHELVHMLSHDFAHRLFPNAKGHGSQHASVEREMIEHVVRSGWLDGKLKRKERPAPTADDLREAKAAGIAAKIKRWETKRKRAETA